VEPERGGSGLQFGPIKMWRNKTRSIAPNEECVAAGTKLLCQIDRGAASRSGIVLDDQSVIRWQYKFRKLAPGTDPGNPFRKPIFVIAGLDKGNEVIIRRASFLPPLFNIRESGKTIGTIAMRSMFRNKYFISIDGVDSWTFRMPLFSIRFYGFSDAGAEIWVEVGPSKKDWNILIKAGVREWPLVAALAFIHNESWHYS